VRHLCHNAAHRGIIGPFHNLIEFGYPQAPHDFLLLLRIADRAFIILDLDYRAVSFFSFLCHFFLFSTFDFRSAQSRAIDVFTGIGRFRADRHP
jgi:hypothetical protein